MKYKPLLHIVLHEPEIPQNTGNLGRTATAVGAKLWLIRPLGFRLDDHYLRRAGLDYWQHLEWEVLDDWSTLAERLPVHAAWFFSKTADREYTSVRFSQGTVLVFGSETKGLPSTLLQARPDRVLRIPMRAEARSLNLASAGAVAVYEAVRQIQANRSR